MKPSKKAKPDKAPKLPVSLGACADAAYRIREERLALQQQVSELQARETALRERIIELLPKSEATGVSGKIARANITRKSVPTVADWDALCEHVRKTGEFDLLQRRVSGAAASARWDDDIDIPGVERYVVVDVSLTKLGAS